MAQLSKLQALKEALSKGSFTHMAEPAIHYVFCISQTYRLGRLILNADEYNAWSASVSARDTIVVIHEGKSYKAAAAPTLSGNGIVLTCKQTAALDYLEDSVTTEIAFGGGLGGGKSVVGCYWIIKRRLLYAGTRGLIGRSVLRTLKLTTLRTLFDVMKKLGLRANRDYKYNQMSSTIEFTNGSAIILKDLEAYPSDPNFDELGSLEITDAFLDEASQLTEKVKNVVRSRIRYKLVEFGLIPKVLYTCNPAKNFIYTEFYKPAKDELLPVTKQFIQSLIDDNPHISQDYRLSLESLDKVSKNRLLLGMWEYSDDPTALIEYDAILACFTNDTIPADAPFITCDVARFGSDKIVIGVWHGWRVKLYHYNKLAITETAELIRRFAYTHNVQMSNIVADSDGIGGGLVDVLGCLSFVNNSRPLDNPITSQPENYLNLKSQCYFMLADKINSGGIFIDCDETEVKEAIIEELEQVKQYKMDQDGKKQVIPKQLVKEAIGRSPDYADCLMFRMWFELCPRLSWVAF